MDLYNPDYSKGKGKKRIMAKESEEMAKPVTKKSIGKVPSVTKTKEIPDGKKMITPYKKSNPVRKMLPIKKK